MTVAEIEKRAHQEASERTGNELAAELQELLGQKLVAYALGDRHPKTIGRYARGERPTDDDTVGTLADLYTIVGILEQGMRRETIRTWMLGKNPRLRDKAPIVAFHEGKADQVKGAAKAFVIDR